MPTDTCRICEANASNQPTIWENEHWVLRHAAAPAGVAGWLTLYSRRHVRGIVDFTDEEALALGPTLRRIHGALEAASGAPRIYSAAMGESVPHFHIHAVPREADPNPSAVGWGVFLLQKEAAEGRITLAQDRVDSIVSAVAEALRD